MSLTAKDTKNVASLARLHLTDAELEEMQSQLSVILDYVEQLQQVNTDDVEPLVHPMPVQNVFREDELRESLPVDQALSNAPVRQDSFFRVPSVLGQPEE